MLVAPGRGACLGGGGAVGGGVGEEAVVHVGDPRGQVAAEPGVALHVGQADAPLWVGHQDLGQQVAALRRHHRMRRQLVLHVQDPLRARKWHSAFSAHSTFRIWLQVL